MNAASAMAQGSALSDERLTIAVGYRFGDAGVGQDLAKHGA